MILAGSAVLLLAGGTTYYLAVYRPSQTVKAPVLQTTVARRGSIVLSASGTGTLQAANQSELAFKATGKLARLNVKVGDHVAEGQLLAELDNAAQEIELEQAQQKLANLTSVSAIGSAQKAVATASQKLRSAELQLEYLISPDVYYWENEIILYQKSVKAAQAASDAAPSDKDAQDKLKKAQDVLGFGQDKLKEALKTYQTDYVPANFTQTGLIPATKIKAPYKTGLKPPPKYKAAYTGPYLAPPTDADILKARQDLTIAKRGLTDAKNLYAAVTGGTVGPHASGTDLIALEQARLDLKSAQDNLQATQIFAPFSGTVVSVTAQVGPVSAIPTPVGNITTTNPVRSTAILTIADVSNLYVETFVDESDYDKFKVGNKANIIFDALPDQTFTGDVTHVDPALNTSSGSAVVSGLVQLDPNSASLLLGMGASVNVIAAQAQNVVVVPLTALHEYAPRKYSVFVMKNGRLAVQLVEVGLQDLVNAEIKSGLQVGDVVSTGLLGTKSP
jgi:RND family efflux transporter MFP subunit